MNKMSKMFLIGATDPIKLSPSERKVVARAMLDDKIKSFEIKRLNLIVNASSISRVELEDEASCFYKEGDKYLPAIQLDNLHFFGKYYKQGETRGGTTNVGEELKPEEVESEADLIEEKYYSGKALLEETEEHLIADKA